MGRYSSLREFTSDARKRKQESNSVDALLKEAQLNELGYQVDRKPGAFGGLFGSGASIRKTDSAAALPEGFVRAGGKVQKDPTFVTPYQRQRMSMMGGDSGLTAGQRTAKDKATQDIFSTVETNRVKRGTLNKAVEGASTVPQGLFGKMRLGASKAFPATKPLFGVSDQNIQDAQELKMALTDATLAETAHTKGAISDAEMYLFKQASANDDFNSPAVIPVLEKIGAFLQADEAAKFGAYQRNYGEDPRTWFGQGQEQGELNFNSPEEADASGLPPGTVVTVQGRRYQI